MPIKRITAETVNELQPGERDQFFWDDKLPGFGVKVTPAGAKIYILQYRMGGRRHKTKRYTIGKEGALRANSARKLAEGLYGEVKNGKDIADEKRKAAEAKRISDEIRFAPYVKEFCETTLKAKWPKSWKATQDCLTLHASRHWGNKPLSEVTPSDVRQLLRKLDHRPATKRNLFAALSFLFNQSKRDGVIASSPLESIEAPPQVAERTRTLNDDEVKWLWGAITEEAQPYRGILEDLVLLGQRRGEVAGMLWSELNRGRKEWHLPASRAKNGCENIIPLTDRMIAKLDQLAGDEKWPRSGLVYSSRAKTPPSGWSKLKRRLDAKLAKVAKEVGAEVAPWKLHDLRRTLATNMQRLGISHETIEHLLNHREKSRTGIAKVYQTHDYKPEKLAALQRWEAELGRLVNDEESKVIAFRRA
jgi:integrase